MNPHGTLSLHETHDVRDCILRWDLQAHVDVVGHGMPFKHLRAFLLAEIPKNPADRAAQFPVHHLSAILWDEHYVVLTMGVTPT